MEQHQDLSINPKDAEIHVLDGGHYFYDKYYKEIAKKVCSFDKKDEIAGK